jgi:DNA-binding GntR family transcriptional regulator
MRELDYYKSNETLSHKYYQIPQELFESSLYKDKLNSDSKILYAFLLDRLSLSIRNHWVDNANRIFLIFTRQEVQEKLGLSEKTVTKAFKQLVDTDLIEEKRQGLGKPNLIYVAKIQYEEKDKISDTENLQVLNSNFYGSRVVESTVQEQENLQTINTNNIKTNIINTNSINPNSDDEFYLKEIKDKCKLEDFTKEEKNILEDVIDSLYYKDTLKVGSVTVNHYKILDKLKLIVKENLIQLLDILKNIPNIQNAKNYLMICLYNNLGNTNISISKKKKNKASYKGRDYEDGSLDFLYTNFAYDNETITT